MYIPKINLSTDIEEIIQFIKRFSFATIITSKNNYPTATHLPFLVSTQDDKIVLTSHFAKANEHWHDIENNTILVIFSEPHAYVSTTNYDGELNVPTWNYISVHAYGQAKVIKDQDQVFKILEKTIGYYEPSFKEKWNSYPDDYKLKMSKGIVAFEVVVTDLQGKKKLSQNRTENEKRNIIENLSKSKDSNEHIIAEYMLKDLL